MRHLLPLILALTLSAAPAAAETLRLGYDVHVGGVRLGRMSLETSVEGGRYRIGVAAKPGGLLGKLVKWTYAAESAGRVGGPAGVSPERFESTRTLRGKRFQAGLAYRPDGTVLPSHDPPQSEEDAAAVPPEHRPGTVDLLSASAAVSLSAEAAGDRCGTRVPVYDGRRRYDVVAAATEPRRIGKSDEDAFVGEAQGCRVEIHPVSGFRKAKGRGDSFWTIAADGKPRHLDLWLGRPVPGGPLVPVRLEADDVFYADIVGRLVSVERVEDAPTAAATP